MTSPDTNYSAALGAVQKKKGLTNAQVCELAIAVILVGWVESKSDPKAVQKGGGPGRGMFQFECPYSAETALQRLYSFEKAYDVELDVEESLDFSRLTADDQRAILIADWVMKTPGDEVGELARGEYPIKEFWLDWHWAGDQTDRAAKAAQWEREMQDYRRLVGRVNS